MLPSDLRPRPPRRDALRRMTPQRQRDTKGELELESLLHRRGLRFRVHAVAPSRAQTPRRHRLHARRDRSLRRRLLLARLPRARDLAEVERRLVAGEDRREPARDRDTDAGFEQPAGRWSGSGSTNKLKTQQNGFDSPSASARSDESPPGGPTCRPRGPRPILQPMNLSPWR